MNENHKLIVVGDIHLQTKEPKKSQCLDFLSWLFNQDFNNENNSLLFLGDLCEINSPYELYEVYVDYFVNRSKFEQIFILQGNHDCANISTVLSLFRPLPKVKVITEWEVLKFYNVNLLALPFYNHESTDKKPMIEVYSNLFDNEVIKNTELHYCCGHIEDETNHFSKKFNDLSKLKVGHFLHGHVHSCNLDKSGHYLGSATLNSSTEHGNTKYLAIIDGETKEYELKEIPKYLEYYTVEYPNPLPKIETRYGIFTIKNALDKQTAISEYSKQAKELGFEFYTNKVLKQRVTEVEIDDVEKSEKPTFQRFAKSVGLSNEVFDICNEVIRLKSEE